MNRLIILFVFLVPVSVWAKERKVSPPSEALIQELRLDPFYKKSVVADGFAIVSSEKVSDFALLEAAYVLDQMLQGREDLRKALVKHKVHFGILGINEFTTDMPEYKNLKPKLYWDKRARGLGATIQVPLVSGGEENILGYDGDPYLGENILIHEFAHAIHEVALREVDKTFDERLKNCFEEAMKQGLWTNTYSTTNRQEYWAEGVQSWFDCNQKKNSQHNGIRTRKQLLDYDPRLSKLLAEVFVNNNWSYQVPSQRKQADHLKDYDPKKAPKFRWPKELLEWNRKNLGDGSIYGMYQDSEIKLRTSARFAGAVESLTWKGKEFIDREDHGRLLQSAANFDLAKPDFFPETFNPTEGGSRKDGDGPFSSSFLYRYDSSKSKLTSITQMAFWLAPGEKSEGHVALNHQVLSDHYLSKKVQIGYKSFANVIDYEVTFTFPEQENIPMPSLKL